MKLEVYYPDDLHDILVTRDLSLVLTAEDTKQLPKGPNSSKGLSSKNWQIDGRVRDHKCFVDFVIFEDLKDDFQFSIKVTPCYDASDLQEFDFNLGKLEINKWKQHEFNK